MKKILFISGHLYMSKRHANFHHITKACAENGNEVTFCTVPNSLSTLLKQNHNQTERFKSYLYAFFPKKVDNIKVSSYVSLMYPLNKSSKLNSLFMWLLQHGYSKTFNTEYDVVVIENGVSLLLFDKLKRLNPKAKFVYRVSDPIKKDNGWQGFLEYENRVIQQFDVISTPASLITKRLLEQYPSAKIKTHYHGIDKNFLLESFPDPYEQYPKNVKHFIFVGASKMDFEFLKIASNVSNNYLFHIIGPFKEIIKNDNIIYYGEIQFEKTIPFIKHADICMQTLVKFPYSELYERTLKFTQYSFFEKPILAPEHMRLKDKNVFSYINTDASIKNAIEKSLEFSSTNFDTAWIKSWNEIAMELCE